MTSRGILVCTALVLALLLAAAHSRSAEAQLGGAKVQAGQATIAQPKSNLTVIQQTSNKAIINFNTFSIPKGSTVQIVEPSTTSIQLDRVVGGNVSSIKGNLVANGQVWLINPNGILFGPGSQINLASLIATTADIKNGDFLSGNYNFGIGSQNPSASVVNQGTIKVASGGSAVLVGAQVTNQGLIEAELGSVVLGGAKTFAIDFTGDKLIQFQITGPVDQTPTNTDGSPATALVSNQGTISANGGHVLLTARAAKSVIDNVINVTGIVEATTAKLSNGEIVLDAGDAGSVTVSGRLDASGKSSGKTGGTIKVLGQQVALQTGATLDVSGDAGGGTVLVGGNLHGAGPEANATTTIVAPGAVIDADALTAGSGGQVVVWANSFTSFAGTITAQGGAAGGNGGLVETSGHNQLSIAPTAAVNTTAQSGTTGTWLLDPANVTISTSADSNESFAGGMYTPTSGAATSNILNTELATNLATSNILVTTTNSGASGGSAGTITVNAPISWSSAHSLTLSAASDITFGGTADTISVTGGAGGITLTSSGGLINVGAALSTITGNIALSGTSVAINAAITSGGTLTISSSTGSITQSAALTVGGTSSFTTSAANATITLAAANALTGAVTLSTNGATGNA
ncbi:MAG TPA: filamentous hemagglutinin N-terminal domain-containing protein, partial [Stellaceae bacterium]|nr:filamentous hemagglutinin N-terminal domain-containing protein [Stellaceae bacterium]